MKSWKKIEDTRKRTNEIQNYKKRNEDKIQKKILDIQLDNEQKRQISQTNYIIQKQRNEEKKKIQDALML